MFKGIGALFTSGIIFHPPVLGGVLLGFLLSFAVDAHQAIFILKNTNLYLIIAILDAIGVVCFGREYIENSNKLDWKSMIKAFLGNLFTAVFSMVLSLIFWNVWVKFFFS